MEENSRMKQDKFRTLLQQLQLTEDAVVQHFHNAEIERVVIEKIARKWHFFFSFDKLIPCSVWTRFTTQLIQSFSPIASVGYSVTVRNPLPTKELIVEYWKNCIGEIDGISPAILELLHGQTPAVEGNKLIIKARNEAEAGQLKRKYAGLISDVYQGFGFPPLQLDTFVDASIFSDEMEIFRKKKQEEDEAKAMQAVQEMKKAAESKDDVPYDDGPLVIGYKIKPDADVKAIDEIVAEEQRIAIEGYVFDAETRELKSGRTLLTFKITDYTNSILVKVFSRDKEDAVQLARVKKGMWMRVQGSVQNDTFVRDLVMIANDINEIAGKQRVDHAPEGEKRVELHLHTPMSQMDAVTPVSALVAQAAKWGHPAIAVTDHAVAQSFPEAYSAGKKNGIKILYGVEVNLIDDGVPIAYNPRDLVLEDSTYVVFDVETTGLSAIYDTIIELAAVKMKNGEIIDRFESFANPHHKLSSTTINLTGITDDLVENAPEVDEVLTKLKELAGDSIFVANNASFDMGFLNMGYKKLNFGKAENPVIDTLELARFLYPDMKNHRLNNLAKKFDVELVQHHRAIYDAETTGHLLMKMLKDANEKGIVNHNQLNDNMGQGKAFQRARPYHCTLLAQTEEGLKNLFKLVSIAHLNYFYRVPRLPRSVLTKYREGILVGSGCDRGEVFENMMQKSFEEAEEAAEFYDYLEVHPKEVYAPLIEMELVRNDKALESIIANIVKIGERQNKPVVATGNVHYLNPNDKIYRKILINSQGGANPLNRHSLPDVHFRTTDEMLQAFSFLGEEKAKEIVVFNTHKVADMIDEIKPIKDDLYTPKIEGADEEIRSMSYGRARMIYGENLPEIVEARLEKELKSIIGHGFAVIYLISHKLVPPPRAAA